MVQKIVLLAGKKGSGKDTLADLVKPHFERASFADPLYREVQEAFGLEDQSILRNRDTKEALLDCMAVEFCRDLQFVNVALSLGMDITAPQSPRRILQLWGTEYRQMTDGREYWVDLLIDFIKATPYVDYCIPDLRFPHEYAGLFDYSISHNADITVFKIERDVEDDSTSGHASETALEGFDIFDHVILNVEGNPESMAEQFWLRV